MPRPALRAAALAPLALPLAGCEDYLFEQVCPEAISEVARTEPELQPTPADILFVVDNSGSMREEQENLAANFAAFIDALAGSGGDYQLAVVTTDPGSVLNGCGTGSGFECGGFSTTVYSDQFPFEFENQLLDACEELPISAACFQPDDDGRTIITSDLPPAELEASFQEAIQVGTCGAGSERGLSTMASALDEARNGCNTGFLRPGANLIVVFVSDERGNSIPASAKADGIQDGELAAFVQALAAAKDGDLSKVRVAAIVGSVDGQASWCRTEETAATDDPPTAQCGSLCEQIPDPLGSEQSCDDNGDCPSGEFCTRLGAADERCVGREWEEYLRNPGVCRDCKQYAAPDCCIAEPGDEYVAFVQRVGALADGRDGRASCQPAEGERTFCLVDSICQENFAVTLDRIARELVAASTFSLDPPADNPEGVRVRISRGEEVDRTLVNGEDFRVSDDGRTFEFLGGEGPREGESIELFYTTERTIDRPLRGACATSTTAS